MNADTEYDKIIVYQYGKVGSNTICNSLAKYYKCAWYGHSECKEEYLDFIISTHNPLVFIDVLKKYKGKKILIINVVRNSIMRLFSDFFEFVGSNMWINKQDEFHALEKHQWLSMCHEHINIMMMEPNKIYTEDVLSSIKDYIGIDIYEEFNKTEKKYFLKHVLIENIDDDKSIKITERSNNVTEMINNMTQISLLVYRFEEIDKLQTILEDTLEITCEIINGNESKNKWYINEYTYCKQNLILDNKIIEEYYKTKHHQCIYKNDDDKIITFKK